MRRLLEIALFGIVLAAQALSEGKDVEAEPAESPSKTSHAPLDPSIIPAPKGEGLHGERIRLLADFDGDGRQDLALSDDTAMGTNAGIGFTLYLADIEGNLIVDAGTFEAHPKAIAIERSDYAVRIWTYSRVDGESGLIGYDELKDRKLVRGKYLTIFPNEGGGTTIGRSIYGAVLGNSDVPIRAEQSRTVDGHVHWNPLYRDVLSVDSLDEIYRKKYLDGKSSTATTP